MRIRKTLIAILALAIAIAFSPDLRAATFVSPDTKVSADSMTLTVAKKKGKAKKKGGKKAKSKGPGKCGTYMYWSKKARKCVDARNKK